MSVTNKYKVGDMVRVNPNNDNECYDSFMDKMLVITHVAKDSNECMGYDSSMSPERLYDLKEFRSGKCVGCSLYDYELIRAISYRRLNLPPILK